MAPNRTMLQPTQLAVPRMKAINVNFSNRSLQLFDNRLTNKEGHWISCDKCHKLRYVQSLQDPSLMINKNFYCNEVDHKCSDMEDPTVAVTKFHWVSYTPGSLVWAHVDVGMRLHWPGIVEDCPDQKSQFCSFPAETVLNDKVIRPTAYYVTLLGDINCGGWVSAEWLSPIAWGFTHGVEALEERKPSTYLREEIMLPWRSQEDTPLYPKFIESLESAKTSYSLSIQERLLSVSAIGRAIRGNDKLRKRFEKLSSHFKQTGQPMTNRTALVNTKKPLQVTSTADSEAQRASVPSKLPSPAESRARNSSQANAARSVVPINSPGAVRSPTGSEDFFNAQVIVRRLDFAARMPTSPVSVVSDDDFHDARVEPRSPSSVSDIHSPYASPLRSPTAFLSERKP